MLACNTCNKNQSHNRGPKARSAITFQLISNIPGDNQPRRRSEPHGTLLVTALNSAPVIFYPTDTFA